MCEVPISPYRYVVPNSQLRTMPPSLLINNLHTPPTFCPNITEKLGLTLGKGRGRWKVTFTPPDRGRSSFVGIGDYELGSSENNKKQK